MINQHVIEINAPKERVFKEIVLWGESIWWPKDSLMKFINLNEEIDVGTVYLQKVNLTFGPRWQAKITDIKDLCSVRRDFLDGMFCGYEVVEVRSDSRVCRVTYKMHYSLKGIFNKVMWRAAFEKLHNKNIKNILESLKEHLEKTNKNAN
ncbi:MAG: SRPBCC family protein [Candidatus Omnitrophota bacterium]|nr:MAG: SRPBCC family protein [Candidatus Omnitrophota bacterium]